LIIPQNHDQDYWKLVPGEYDYVITGGGSAGCTLAARLAEGPSLKLCLVEAGDW
jgi:choline dehydrogenase-like flavoprotein